VKTFFKRLSKETGEFELLSNSMPNIACHLNKLILAYLQACLTETVLAICYRNKLVVLSEDRVCKPRVVGVEFLLFDYSGG